MTSKLWHILNLKLLIMKVCMANPFLSMNLLNVLQVMYIYIPSTGGSRSLGVGVILGGYDRDGPQLYVVEPSGITYRYFAAAIGKGKQVAKTEIEKLKLSGMTCRKGSPVEVAKMSEHARSFVKTNNLQGIVKITGSHVP